jgi:hypothetical protein
MKGRSMKRLMFVLVLCGLLVSPYLACGSPFLTCDPQATVEYYYVSGLAPEPVKAAIKDTAGALWHDLASLPVGSYTVKARACKVDASWGEVCSDESLPFSFTRPSKSAVPVKLLLSK